MSAAEAPAGSTPPPPAWQIQAQGDRCLLVRFGDAIDARTGQVCLAAARLLREAALPGVTDIVPSFAAVAVHYRPGRDGPGPDSPGPGHAGLAAAIEHAFSQGIRPDEAAGREIEIPVCYGGEHGPDLAEIASRAGIGEDEIVARHTQPGSMVFMLGFAPGLAYIGVPDEKLDVPRRATPRLSLPAGSVAVANRQSVIYPCGNLPGGWNVIGATPLVLFDPARDPPALLAPGDRIRFKPIDAQTFRRLKKGAT